MTYENYLDVSDKSVHLENKRMISINKHKTQKLDIAVRQKFQFIPFK